MKIGNAIGVYLLVALSALSARVYAAEIIVTSLPISFDIPDVIINEGDSVTWIDLAPTHNIAETNGPVDESWNGTGFFSGIVGAVETYTVTFTSPGLFYYVCEPHAQFGMKGTVTVIGEVDSVPPVAVCQDITVAIGPDGTVTITGADVDEGSTDNVAVTSLSVSPNTFSCANLGENQVELTVSDAAGNSSTCMATVTVENPNDSCETVPPVAICQNIIVEIGLNGTVSINGSAVDGGSTDNIGIASLSVTPNVFTCGNIGDNQVELTVFDAAGNSSTCTATVTVENPNDACERMTYCEVKFSGVIASQLSEINIGALVFEGLPVDASIALIDFHTCNLQGIPGLALATETAYQINQYMVEGYLFDTGNIYLVNLTEAVAILMTISSEVQQETIDQLYSGFGINVVGPFEIVTGSAGTFMPSASGNRMLTEEYLVFSDDYISTRNVNEPYSGAADLDNDGVSNAQEYNDIVVIGGGSMNDFVIAASVPDSVEPPESSGGGGGGDGCFIATAAYGSPMEEEIDVLREFRDTWLLTHSVGQAFTDIYYRLSPPLADFIAQRQWARVLTREALAPVIYLTRSSEWTWVLLALGLLIILAERSVIRPR